MKNKNFLTVIVVFILLSSMFVSGDGVKAVVQAVEEQVQVFYNGNPAQIDKKPLIVNGSIYMPLEAFAVLFNKNVIWNSQTKILDMGDKTDPAVAALRNDMAVKEEKIKALDEKVKQLEQEAAELKPDMDMLEQMVNKEHGTYKDISFTILLSGSTEDFRVRILVDLGLNQKEWTSLSSGDRQDYLEEICGAVSAYYPYAKLKGYILNTKTSSRLLHFYNTAAGEVKTGAYKHYSTIGSLEEEINTKLDTYFNNVSLIYQLTGNENRVDCSICMPIGQYEKEWTKLSDYKVKQLLGKIADEIERDFKGTHIYGSVYIAENKQLLASFWKEPLKKLEYVREEQ